MQAKTLVTNALIAALYVVITAVIAPFGFTHIQFRVSELFNHLIVFNKKYFIGIIIGVFFANWFFSPMKVDLIFGLTHSILSLLITMIIARFIMNKLILMCVNTIVFSFNMFIIAYMLKVFADLPEAFLFLWMTLGISEFLVMIVTIPIVLMLNKQLNFKKLV